MVLRDWLYTFTNTLFHPLGTIVLYSIIFICIRDALQIRTITFDNSHVAYPKGLIEEDERGVEAIFDSLVPDQDHFDTASSDISLGLSLQNM